MEGQQAIRTDVPARLDRLPWSPFHRLVVAALGITWVLDGLEVTLAGSVAAGPPQNPPLPLTAQQVRPHGTASLTGAGIGGEYTAITSAIQELIPARLRGRTDLAINGSFWLGAALGASGSIWLLDPAVLSPEIGWRLAFGTGAVLGLVILYLRRFVPQSPRWLMTHRPLAEAEAVVAELEGRVTAATGAALAPAHDGVMLLGGGRISLATVARTLLCHYSGRTVLGLVLMASQAFFYNAIFFTYALVLTRFYRVPRCDIGWDILPLPSRKFPRPPLLGPLFHPIRRQPQIAAPYTLSGLPAAAPA